MRALSNLWSIRTDVRSVEAYREKCNGKLLLTVVMFITHQSYHFADYWQSIIKFNFWRTTIFHQCGFYISNTFSNTFGETFPIIRLRRGRRGRRLLCGWTQRFQKGTSLFGWFATFQNGSLQLFYSVDLQLFQRCYILYVKVSPSAQVLFDSRLWFNTEIFSRAPFLNIVFQIWAYIPFFKEHKACLTRIVIYVYRCWFTNRWCLRLHIWYVIAFPLYEQDFQRAACAVHFNRQRVMRLMRHRGKG